MGASWIIGVAGVAGLIDELDPGVVVAVGGEALHAVGQIERHGLKLKTGVGQLHGWNGRKLLPLYHPSRLGRVSRPEDKQREDIKALVPYLLSIDWSKSER